jgi:SnoaL-like polyketide cyclase
MTADFYDHDGPSGKPTGVDGDEQMMIAMYKSMPDLHVTIEEMVAKGDKVMCRNLWRFTDTASGQMMQFHGLCCGASRKRRSPNVGPQSLRPSRNRSRQRSTKQIRAIPSLS